MKVRRAYSFLAGVAVLGATAAYIEVTRTTAQPSDQVVKSGDADRVARPQETERAAKSGETGTVRVAARPADPAVDSRPGNPLWVLPLKQLAITRDRPIFSPSRRPPPAPAVAAPRPQVVKPQAKPAEPERPAVTLLGTIVGSTDRLGVFQETATRNVIKMRVGEDHQGWVLRTINSRDVTLAKEEEQTVLELPPPGGELPPGIQGLQGVPGMQGAPSVQGLPGQGVPRAPGMQPVQGVQGVQGVPGVQGVQGAPGVQAAGRQQRR